MPLTGDRTYVPSERSGLPTIAIIGAIKCRDVPIVTGNSAVPVLAKDTTDATAVFRRRSFVVLLALRYEVERRAVGIRGRWRTRRRHAIPEVQVVFRRCDS